ncbi:hypothetical protein OG618_18165 [Kitasatospora sp. NBC_01246]|uniref:hypothetical protein n=1 Tax=Kitasatospora sp. NBC_01246 TaxID=2903570 RepID=UPI002E3433EA|nr:hypothetical protein [Kitasatospora sp. NBC_01246]
MTSIRAARFAAAYALLRSAADVADHWVQSDHQATTKGQRGEAGRRACASHVAAYTAVQAGVLLGGAQLLGIRLRPGPVAAGLALSATTHYVADRREPLRRLADATGKGRFVRLADHGMNGAYALDQAWHHGWETAAALIASI